MKRRVACKSQDRGSSLRGILPGEGPQEITPGLGFSWGGTLEASGVSMRQRLNATLTLNPASITRFMSRT